MLRFSTFTQSSVSAQQNSSSRGTMGSSQRLLNDMPLTEESTSVYRDLRSDPMVGGRELVAPDGLQGMQPSRVTFSNGVANVPVRRAI